MEEVNNYSKFTEERYKALYDRIYRKQEKLILQFTEFSRDSNKGYEFATMLYSSQLYFKKDELLKEAIDLFGSAYPLWYKMPELIELVEPIRLKMLDKYYQSLLPTVIETKTKTIKRFKLLGFIPFLPQIQEEYNSAGELLQRNHFELDMRRENLEQFAKARSKEEKEILSMSIYRLKRVENFNSLEIKNVGIFGEPTRKKLFHAIVKHRAINDFFNHLRESDVTNFKKLIALYKESSDSTVHIENNNAVNQRNNINPQFAMEGSRKRQAIAFYYLLTAGNVKGILSNKAELARFIAFMSGYDLEGEGKAKNIYNSSFYTIVKELFGQRTMDFKDDDLEAVVKSFQRLNKDENTILTSAIELINEDRKA
jgi:hypothetical protein